jgi:hypothetical protein
MTAHITFTQIVNLVTKPDVTFRDINSAKKIYREAVNDNVFGSPLAPLGTSYTTWEDNTQVVALRKEALSAIQAAEASLKARDLSSSSFYRRAVSPT